MVVVAVAEGPLPNNALDISWRVYRKNSLPVTSAPMPVAPSRRPIKVYRITDLLFALKGGSGLSNTFITGVSLCNLYAAVC